MGEHADSVNAGPKDLAVLRLGAHRVASFARYFDGQPLAIGEKLFRVTFRGSTAKVEPGSFMFQEGFAAQYQNARYGVFSVASSGDHMLIGLADDNFNVIEIANAAHGAP